MLAKKYTDLKNRHIFSKHEKKNLVQKFLFRFFIIKKLQSTYCLKVLKNSFKVSKTKIVNRCVFTNRNRGVLRDYSMSRLFLKELMEFGIVAGSKKAVW